MKKIILLALVFIASLSIVFGQAKAGKQDTARHTSFYSCPKHPDFVSHTPGKCAQCGMKLSLSGKESMKAAESKNFTCPVHMDVTSHNPGKCPKCGKELTGSPKEQMKTVVMKTYTCPMHPEVALNKKGECPKCGMALVEKKTTR